MRRESGESGVSCKSRETLRCVIRPEDEDVLNFELKETHWEDVLRLKAVWEVAVLVY